MKKTIIKLQQTWPSLQNLVGKCYILIRLRGAKPSKVNIFGFIIFGMPGKQVPPREFGQASLPLGLFSPRVSDGELGRTPLCLFGRTCGLVLDLSCKSSTTSSLTRILHSEFATFFLPTDIGIWRPSIPSSHHAWLTRSEPSRCRFPMTKPIPPFGDLRLRVCLRFDQPINFFEMRRLRLIVTQGSGVGFGL